MAFIPFVTGLVPLPSPMHLQHCLFPVKRSPWLLLRNCQNVSRPDQVKRDELLRANRNRIEPLKKFARNFKDRLAGILAHRRWPLHTSLLKGINNKIKVIKRMAFASRDDDCFFLRIRANFPGIRPGSK